MQKTFSGSSCMIATIINYCTNDFRFIGRCIREARKFSRQIIVPVCDHFFDGSPENRALLDATYAAYPDVLFLEFAYNVKRLYTPYIQRLPEDEDWGALWHSTARYLAFLYLAEEIQYLLFLDADEIVEGERFSSWLREEDYQQWEALWFFAYCYGFQASKRSPDLQQTALLTRRGAVSPLKIFSAQERFGLFAGLAGPKRLQIFGLDGNPMIHHYSWVRPRAECLKKSSTWGKKDQCDWKTWLATAQSEMKNYQDVKLYFDPLTVSVPTRFSKGQSFSHVIQVNPQIAFRRELDALLY
jgi:hypothetical protein